MMMMIMLMNLLMLQLRKLITYFGLRAASRLDTSIIHMIWDANTADTPFGVFWRLGEHSSRRSEQDGGSGHYQPNTSSPRGKRGWRDARARIYVNFYNTAMFKISSHIISIIHGKNTNCIHKPLF